MWRWWWMGRCMFMGKRGAGEEAKQGTMISSLYKARGVRNRNRHHAMAFALDY
jgi:hypothetical protein